MIRRVAVVPQTPLLVPELTGAGLVGDEAAEVTELRAACVAAVRWLIGVSARWTALADVAHAVGPAAAGTFGGYGVPVPVRLAVAPASTAEEELPLPALVAGWLREQAGAEAVTVRPMGAPVDGAALLVLGDGSNRHGPKSPGYQDARAGEFDDTVAAALAAADPVALGALDAGLAAELGAGGVPVWHALAEATRDGHWRGELYHSAAPFGVAYHVAVWERR